MVNKETGQPMPDNPQFSEAEARRMLANAREILTSLRIYMLVSFFEFKQKRTPGNKIPFEKKESFKKAIALEAFVSLHLVSAAKQVLGLPVEVPAQEERVIGRAMTYADLFGFDRDEVRRFMKPRIEFSKVVQREPDRFSSSEPTDAGAENKALVVDEEGEKIEINDYVKSFFNRRDFEGNEPLYKALFEEEVDQKDVPEESENDELRNIEDLKDELSYLWSLSIVAFFGARNEKEVERYLQALNKAKQEELKITLDMFEEAMTLGIDPKEIMEGEKIKKRTLRHAMLFGYDMELVEKILEKELELCDKVFEKPWRVKRVAESLPHLGRTIPSTRWEEMPRITDENVEEQMGQRLLDVLQEPIDLLDS